MRNDAPPVDYRKAKVSALQQLAAGGDSAAARELQRRGIDPSTVIDVTALDYLGLRSLVEAWRDGVTAEDLSRNRATAERAQFELECRYRVDVKLWDADGRELASESLYVDDDEDDAEDD